MKSLESEIRNLMITIALEQDQITLVIDKADPDDRWRYTQRRTRLGKLANRLITNIDKEIEFFKNN